MNEGRPVPVKAARRTMRIVEALHESGGAGVSELSRELDIPKSTVHDHLNTLEQDGYLRNDGDQYRLSSRFLEIGGRMRTTNLLYQVGQPEVDALAKETGEHANIMIEEQGLGVFLYVAKGSEAVQVDSVHHMGTHAHLHTTALGKAILAHFPRERTDEIIDQHGLPAANDRTVTDRDALYDELETIRDRGYAIDDQERVEGMRCIGVPISTSDTGVLGAISVSAPVSRMQDERFESEIPHQIQRTANIIEVNINYS